MAATRSPHAQETLGRELEVLAHADPGLVGRTGRVVDETRETLCLSTSRGELRIPKANGRFKMNQNHEPALKLNGSRLTYRSQDRVKRGI